MTQDRINEAELAIENRRLRRALETLLDELEQGGQPDLSRVRDKLPQRNRDGIQPPWEREGFDSKDEWLAEKRPDHAAE